MGAEYIQGIGELLGLNPDETELVPVEGGFTGAQKYIVRTHELAQKSGEVFIKLVDLVTHPDEAVVLDTEAAMYGIISGLDDIKKYFPRYIGYTRDDKVAALFMDYLSDLSWGGPWTPHNIELLAFALEKVHATPLDTATKQEITQRADALRAKLYEQSPYTFNRAKRKQLFQQAIDSSQGTFTNSRGHTYSRIPSETMQDISHSAAAFDPKAEERLCITDLNFGNIGFASDQVYFVDPVYMEIGTPSTDMVNVGINTLRALSENKDQAVLIEKVRAKFLADKQAFADAITYWVACTSLPYPGQENAWMDFQQDCAVAALKTWVQMRN